MPGVLSDPWEIALGGYRLSVIADPEKADEDIDPSYLGTFVAQDSAKQLRRQDVSVDGLSTFRRGSGFIVRHGPDDDGGIAWCENGISWLENGLTITGMRRSLGNGLGLTAAGTTINNVAITDSRPFNGHRWCITSGGYVIRFPNDDPTQTPVFDPALNAFTSASTSLHTGYVAQAIEVFATASGVPALYISACNASAGNTRLYQGTVTGATVAWTTATAVFTTARLSKLAGPVWWEGNDGIGAQRLLGAYDDHTIRHVVYGTDPLIETNWVTPITLDPSAPINRIIAFPEFAFALTKNGLWTFNAVRAMNVTPYATVGSSYSDGSVVALYHGGVVWARGWGLDFYDAAQNYRRQDVSVDVGPMRYMQDGTPIRGQITGLVPFEGALIQALYNHHNKTTYIGRAYPREVVNVNSRNPLVHYWAEHVLGGTATTGQQVTHLMVSSPTVSGSTVTSDRTVNLWMFTADEPFTAGSNFNLTYAPLPQGNGPLSLQAGMSNYVLPTTAGTTTFGYLTQGVGQAKFYLTAQNWDDDLAKKYLSRYDILRYLQAKTMSVYVRTDGNPATVSDPSTWSAVSAATISDSDTLTPATAQSGNIIGTQIVLQTDDTRVGPIVRSASLRAKVVREAFKTLTLWVILERDHPLATGVTDLRDPDTVADAVLALQNGGPQTYVPEIGGSHSVYVEQGEGFVRQYVGDNEWRTLIELHLTQVS